MAPTRWTSSDIVNQAFEEAERTGIRLEIVRGVGTWEAHPAYAHQREIDRIRASIRPRASVATACRCVHVSDVYVRFPDGSLKRPDISIFCREPDEKDTAVTLVPEAVIEVVSPGFEAKDLELGPPFYLSQGVKDVVVFNPATMAVVHSRRDSTVRVESPSPIALECGCDVTA